MRWPSERRLVAAAAVVATVATAGSLYFSLGMGLQPCELCWYQRILMYPLVVVLGVAALDDRLPHRTALPLAGPGIALAAYHSYLQATMTTCGLSGPCATVQFRLPTLGLTIPNLSLVAFLLVTGLVGAAWRTADRR
jgi:disulfide bond formation protein DsbB